MHERRTNETRYAERTQAAQQFHDRVKAVLPYAGSDLTVPEYALQRYVFHRPTGAPLDAQSRHQVIRELIAVMNEPTNPQRTTAAMTWLGLARGKRDRVAHVVRRILPAIAGEPSLLLHAYTQLEHALGANAIAAGDWPESFKAQARHARAHH